VLPSHQILATPALLVLLSVNTDTICSLLSLTMSYQPTCSLLTLRFCSNDIFILLYTAHPQSSGHIVSYLQGTSGCSGTWTDKPAWQYPKGFWSRKFLRAGFPSCRPANSTEGIRKNRKHICKCKSEVFKAMWKYITTHVYSVIRRLLSTGNI